MDEKDLVQIEQMVAKAFAGLSRQLLDLSEGLERHREETARQFAEQKRDFSEQFAKHREETSQELVKYRQEMAMDAARFRREITQDFQQRIGSLSRDIDHKLNLAIDTQQLLVERFDTTRIEMKEGFDRLDHRLTVLAADLSEHVRDRSMHYGAYRVKED